MKKSILLVSAALALSARADVVRTNECFAVAWNAANGALASLVMNGDADRMNWIEGLECWGEIRTNARRIDGRDGWTGAAFRDSEKLPFKGLREEGGKVVSVYDNGLLRAEVVRELTRDALKERYVFTNVSQAPLYFGRGNLGILATFNDDYAGADECIRRRCSAHVWCGGGNSWVRAVKMGPFPTELALVLSEVRSSFSRASRWPSPGRLRRTVRAVSTRRCSGTAARWWNLSKRRSSRASSSR